MMQDKMISEKANEPLLSIRDLVCHFPVRSGLMRRQVGAVQAVDNISFSVAQGEGLGIVGESGCGKSTLINTILQLVPANSGNIIYDGKDVRSMSRSQLRHWRREVQMVFQNPFASLDPRMTIGQIVEEPLVVGKSGLNRNERLKRVIETLEMVGADSRQIDRYPHQLSGGQRQRVGIARALVLRPKLLVLDEPVSALDVSVQAQVLNLLERLRHDLGLTTIFIGHDLSVVSYVSDRIAVMYLGRIVEIGTREEVFKSPKHPYTQALLSAVPSVKKNNGQQRVRLKGDPPNPANPPSGCRFHTRCSYATELCSQSEPKLVVGSEHAAACHFK
ncbi:ABC transporter ATP-binding protein [Paenochrobactrum glaciei]|uniref:Dipeptide ABC transporter ATP-binding protein n=1 Tax=Paenochrobactrum glaciei TaxID=486407 RepID=A0ABP3RWR9_9HYPH